MRSLKWSISHAVFVAEIEDEHKEIFEALSNVQEALGGAPAQIRTPMQRLVTAMVDHFAHEERLMRAARYTGMRWHKKQHENARKRVEQFVRRIGKGDAKAGPALVEYLSSWLGDHARLSDRMMGASLRNHKRGLFKMTFRAGTKPMDACAWVDANGDRFDPSSPR